VRFIIYGAGGIGCVIGGHLARTGHEVLLVGRPGQVNAINEHGLRLVTPAGTYVLRIPAVTRPALVEFTRDDVVFLCMKGQNTEEALRELQLVTRDVPVFCIQNGIRNEAIAGQYFPRVYGAMVRIGADYLTDGEVVARRDPPGLLIIGRYPQGIDTLAEEVAERLRSAGLLIQLTPDVMPYKWGKLLGNLGNAIDAITGVWGPDVESISRAARAELTGLLEQAGISWVSQEALNRQWPEIRMPPRPSAAKPMHSSTWQSLARRQGSVETDFLNGEVVRLAERMGGRVPVNKRLLEITQEMAVNRELPGKYTAAELKSLLGLT
jgi:2-dehydropantoate 2-reductase